MTSTSLECKIFSANPSPVATPVKMMMKDERTLELRGRGMKCGVRVAEDQKSANET